ncbi:M10 family metallopeptidase C-terminal domain-containing protein [Neogemmobacter tilapiae]|uniref:Calcium-binding protein n=1 Tax=Neogemmobacter tilapiae TaxID=875041 RepID=A0A918TMM4_9RHOB|nr:calcium-binding protein [Gemmobacter tilapiae]GHC48825.1 hypothetical protein GCM10007315_08610 [Gemmobacter tilapiae]
MAEFKFGRPPVGELTQGVTLQYFHWLHSPDWIRVWDDRVKMESFSSAVTTFYGSDFARRQASDGTVFVSGLVNSLYTVVDNSFAMKISDLSLSMKRISYFFQVDDSEGCARYILRGDDQITLTSGWDIFFGGRGDDVLWGKGQNDELSGDSGNDSLFGGRGDDVLTGGRGRDELTGDAGADHFRFRNAREGDADKIMDFAVGEDKIVVNAAFFDLPEGALDDDAFHLGKVAEDAEDRFLYDAATGRLLFDADGTGDGQAVLLARLMNRPALQASDFLVGLFG